MNPTVETAFLFSTIAGIRSYIHYAEYYVPESNTSSNEDLIHMPDISLKHILLHLFWFKSS